MKWGVWRYEQPRAPNGRASQRFISQGQYLESPLLFVNNSMSIKEDRPAKAAEVSLLSLCWDERGMAFFSAGVLRDSQCLLHKKPGRQVVGNKMPWGSRKWCWLTGLLGGPPWSPSTHIPHLGIRAIWGTMSAGAHARQAEVTGALSRSGPL